MLSLGSAYLRIDVFTFPLMAIGMTVSRSMQAMGYGLPGLVINVARILVVAVPLAYIFVFVLGLSYLSIAVAMVIGAVIASIIALIWIRIEFKKLEKKS